MSVFLKYVKKVKQGFIKAGGQRHNIYIGFEWLKDRMEECETNRFARLDIINRLDAMVKEYQRSRGSSI